MLLKRECKLHPVEDTELEIDLSEVVLDYLLAGAEMKSNLLIVHASRDAGDQPQLHG